MNDENKALAMLGFSRKANQVVAGESSVKNSLFKKNELNLIIIATDLSPGRQKYWEKLAFHFNIPCKVAFNKVKIGTAIGMSPRVVIGIKNKEMAKKIEVILQI